MRIEIIIFTLAMFIIVNIYTDGKLLKRALSYKKYYQMAGVLLIAFFLCYLVKHNPLKTREIIMSSNEYVKYLPIDKSTCDMITPILDFSTRQYSTNPTNLQQGGKIFKRSVSETKKKFVAASQNWKCMHCEKQLTASFEVDHKLRLDSGGSNDVENLVALCRECHGEKTTIENL